EDFKRHLPTVSLIDVLPSPSEGIPYDYRLRLAGTGLYEVYRGEITGKRLNQVYDQSSADYWRKELDKVVQDRRPGVGSHSLAWRGAPHLSILWLRLPLASDGRRVDMILGYDVVVGAQGEYARTGIRAA
ncbi:PAS domain-containing protein, partial [Mycobacterium tuberculosis]